MRQEYPETELGKERRKMSQVTKNALMNRSSDTMLTFELIGENGERMYIHHHYFNLYRGAQCIYTERKNKKLAG